jgi:hypothetical protein
MGTRDPFLRGTAIILSIHYSNAEPLKEENIQFKKGRGTPQEHMFSTLAVVTESRQGVVSCMLRNVSQCLGLGFFETT